MDTTDLQNIGKLVAAGRWAALATVEEGAPLGSMVCYAVEEGGAGLLLHLSQLSRHTKNLLENPAVSLVISEPDDGREDPQTLARVSVQGRVVALERETAEYGKARERYQNRFPASAPRFGFGDFMLFRLVSVEARYVGGFGKAGSVSGQRLREVLKGR